MRTSSLLALFALLAATGCSAPRGGSGGDDDDASSPGDDDDATPPPLADDDDATSPPGDDDDDATSPPGDDDDAPQYLSIACGQTRSGNATGRVFYDFSISEARDVDAELSWSSSSVDLDLGLWSDALAGYVVVSTQENTNWEAVSFDALPAGSYSLVVDPYAGTSSFTLQFNCGAAQPDPPDCTSHASQACYDGDVYWYDSCGDREDRDEYCGADSCIGSGGVASCLDLEFRCEDSGHTCYSSFDELWVEFECEVRNQGTSTVTLESLLVEEDNNGSNFGGWLDDSWTGSASLPPGQWVALSDDFKFAAIDDFFGEELRVEGDLEACIGSDCGWMYDENAENTWEIRVLDSWICW